MARKRKAKRKSAIRKLGSKLTEQEFYCVKCRGRVKVRAEDMCVTVFRNKRMKGGSPALRAKCPKCGTNLTKFRKHDAKERLTRKYGRCKLSVTQKYPSRNFPITIFSKVFEWFDIIFHYSIRSS